MSEKLRQSILFLGKDDDMHCENAVALLKSNFSDVSVYLGKWGEKFPEEIKNWQGDYVISYLSRWIVPKNVIDQARCAAINFHPGSPQYPGFGCYNFALYEDSKEYGVTCHHMAKKVDTGNIIAVRRFPIYASDSVRSLVTRTHDYQLALYYDVIDLIIKGEILPVAKENWHRKPFTRQGLDQLSVISPQMPEVEINKRIRATSYGSFQPVVEVGGHTFVLQTSGENES